MSFNWKALLSGAGELLEYVPGIAPIAKAANAVAHIVGGSAGEKITAGLTAVTEGLVEAGKEPLSPGQRVELAQSRDKAKVELAEIKYKDKKLDYDDAAGGRDVIKTALLSDDALVRQARPKMMVRLGNWAIGYTICSPFIIGILAICNVSKEIIEVIITLLLYQGGTLWATFSAAFTGYTVARSVDKKILKDQSLGIPTASIFKTIAKLGHKIS